MIYQQLPSLLDPHVGPPTPVHLPASQLYFPKDSGNPAKPTSRGVASPRQLKRSNHPEHGYVA